MHNEADIAESPTSHISEKITEQTGKGEENDSAQTMTATILVIDDSADDQRLCQRAFKDFDYFFSLVMASSADAGFACITGARPDLILLDYNLPDMDGLSFMKRLAEFPGTPVPVVMLAGESNAALAVEAIKQGACDYLVKDAGGQYLSLLPGVVGRVVAAHAQREQVKLRQQETEMLLRRNQILMQTSTDGIHIMDMQGNVIEANDAFCRMLGYTQEEVVQLNVADWDALHSEDDLRARFIDLIGKSIRVETLQRRKNGDLINVEVNASGMLMGNQKLIYSSSRDITERKKAEIELRNREALLNAVMKGLPIGVWITDKEGKIIFGNNYGRQILAGSHYVERDGKAERFGEQSDLCSEYGKSITLLEMSAVQAIGKGNVPVEETIEIVCADGAHKNILNIAHSYCGSGGDIAGAVIVNQDITERKKAEEEKLLDSDLRFRGTLEQAAVGIVHISMDGHIHQTNQKFCEIVGYSREELLQMKFTDIMHSGDWGSSLAQLNQLRDGQIPVVSEEKRYVCKDQSVIWVNLTFSLLRKADGVPAYFIGVIEDIADRKNAEVLAQQYGHLLQSSFNEIYLIDAHTLYFILTSEGAEKNLGYSPEELNQMTPLDLSPSLTRDSLAQQLTLLQSGKQRILSFESSHLRKDGSTYLTDVRLQYMPSDFPMFMAIVQDITEHKQAYTELAQSRKLLRDLVAQNDSLREEERKRIARELHDELGQLLTALRMNVALLRIEFGEHDAALLEKTKGIAELLDQAIKCTRDVVSNLRPVALDMGVVPAVKWLRDEFIKHTGTPCVVYVPDEEIHLDEILSVSVFRAVQESLTNIARYAQASKVEVTIMQDADNFSVTINDNGKGFDYAGIGNRKSFGLLGMRERALALGGTVNIYSAPQQGTQIFFVVPTNHYLHEGR